MFQSYLSKVHDDATANSTLPVTGVNAHPNGYARRTDDATVEKTLTHEGAMITHDIVFAQSYVFCYMIGIENIACVKRDSKL